MAHVISIHNILRQSRHRRPAIEKQVAESSKRFRRSAADATIASIRVELAAAKLVEDRERLLRAGH